MSFYCMPVFSVSVLVPVMKCFVEASTPLGTYPGVKGMISTNQNILFKLFNISLVNVRYPCQVKQNV